MQIKKKNKTKKKENKLLNNKQQNSQITTKSNKTEFCLIEDNSSDDKGNDKKNNTQNILNLDIFDNNQSNNNSENKKNFELTQHSITSPDIYFQIPKEIRPKVRTYHCRPNLLKELAKYKNPNGTSVADEIYWNGYYKDKTLCLNNFTEFQVKNCLCCSINLPLLGLIGFFSYAIIKSSICEYEYLKENIEDDCSQNLIIQGIILLVGIILFLCTCFFLYPKVIFRKIWNCICLKKDIKMFEEQIELQEVNKNHNIYDI